MRLLAYILLALPAVLPLPAAATTAQRTVEQVCMQKPLSSGMVGVLAVSTGGDTIACHNGGHCFVPASNLKLLTCGVALNVLGSDFRFRTVIACSGGISKGVLKGNLYIIGGGDPTTAVSDSCTEALFHKWKSFLDNAGIKRIDGAVIGDGGCFYSISGNESWSAYDRSHSYGANVSGLNFYENSQKILLHAPRKCGRIVDYSVVYPETPWMEIHSSAVTCTAEKAEGISYLNTPMAQMAELTGSCRAGRGSFELIASNCFPELTCAYYFYKYLNDNGVQVSDYLSASSRGVKLRRLGVTESDKLKDIVAFTLCHSDNFYAETLLRAIGRKTGDGTVKSGLKAEKDWLRRHGVETDGILNPVDGSGLSRKNFASPSFFVRYLLAMMRSGGYGDFVCGLPHPGEGTLEQRLPGADDSLRRRIVMKSGSMNGTLCFSGYIFPENGATDRALAFSIMTNNVKGGSRVTGPMIDRILTALAEEI